MKLFTKLFSGIMLILAVSLGFAEYYTVYRTFDTTLEHEKDNALRKHQLVKYALQADMVSAENLEMLDETTLQELVDRTEDSFNMQFELENVENMENADAADPEYLYYSIQDENGKQEIQTVAEKLRHCIFRNNADWTYIFDTFVCQADCTDPKTESGEQRFCRWKL